MRNKRLLAVVLAASMAFSMNTFAFASEPAFQEDKFEAVAEDTAEVEEVGAEEAESETVKDETAGVDSESAAKNEEKKEDKEEAPVSVGVTDRDAAIDYYYEPSDGKWSDPVSWNQPGHYNEFWSVVGRYDRTHLTNGVVTTTSGNTFGNSASRNSISLGNGDYLLMAYGFGYGLNEVKDNGVWPIAEYDGRNFTYNEKEDKQNNKNNDKLDIYAAVVHYDSNAKTITRLDNGDLKIKVKKGKGADMKSACVSHNVAANVLGEYNTLEAAWDAIDKSNHSSLYYDVVNGKYVVYYITYNFVNSKSSIPSFTLNITGKKDVKKLNKAMKTALKDKEFKFAIARAVFGGYESNVLSTDKTGKLRVDTDAIVHGDAYDDPTVVGLSRGFAIKAKGKGTLELSYLKKGEIETYALDKNDYTIEKKTINKETVYVVTKVDGGLELSNNDYITKAGYSFGRRYIKGADDDGNEGYGIYKSDADCFFD